MTFIYYLIYIKKEIRLFRKVLDIIINKIKVIKVIKKLLIKIK